MGKRLLRVASPAGGALLLAGCAMEGVQSAMAPVTRDAWLVERLGWWMFGVAAFVFIVTMGVLIVGLSLQRLGRNPLSFRASVALVVSGGVVAPILAIAAVTFSGVAISGETERWSEAGGPTIEVIGRRWWWEFRYLDAEGALIAETANELHLPVGERARLRLLSDNVIHSFWAPNLQGKTDLIPGKINYMYAEPQEAGVWRGQCAEFCGLQHALMGLVVVAEPPEAYEAWLARQAAPAAAAVVEHPGYEVFMRAGCDECHAIRGTAADGDFGPDLTHLAGRRTLAAATIPNTRGNLGGWITSTQEVKPGALMPAYNMDPEALLALLDYLERLE